MLVSPIVEVPVSIALFLVTALATALQPVFGGASTAAAIACFTLAVRLVLLPLSYAQVRAERNRARLQPAIQRLRERYRHNPERLQREMAALYASEGSAPFGGCLPTLLQLPFFVVLYRLFTSATIGGRGNGLLSHGLFGMPLGETWFATIAASGPVAADGFVFLVLFGLLALVAWWSSRRLRTTQVSPMPGAAGTLVRLLPFGTVAVATVVPLAAGLYLLVTTTWTTVERAVLWRWTSAASSGGRGS